MPASITPSAREPQSDAYDPRASHYPVTVLVFLLLPIYWLVNMSFKTNGEIVSTMTLWPHQPTLENYTRIFTDESWYSGYINSLKYVIINTVLSISFALPAAYAFSRYRFLGDKHLFFWLLSNRMAPPACFALPFFNLYSAIGLFDTPWAVALAHCLFNVPLAVWILEGFVSGVPREIDETAFLDGYSFPKLLREDLRAADRQRASASPPSSASCSPGSNCCLRAR
jgi:glycerol transport system permease protein